MQKVKMLADYLLALYGCLVAERALQCAGRKMRLDTDDMNNTSPFTLISLIAS